MKDGEDALVAERDMGAPCSVPALELVSDILCVADSWRMWPLGTAKRLDGVRFLDRGERSVVEGGVRWLVGGCF